MIVTEGMWDTALRLHAEAQADGLIRVGTPFEPSFEAGHYGLVLLRLRGNVETRYGAWDKTKIPTETERKGTRFEYRVYDTPTRYVLIERSGKIAAEIEASAWRSAHPA